MIISLFIQCLPLQPECVYSVSINLKNTPEINRATPASRQLQVTVHLCSSLVSLQCHIAACDYNKLFYKSIVIYYYPLLYSQSFQFNFSGDKTRNSSTLKNKLLRCTLELVSQAGGFSDNSGLLLDFVQFPGLTI